MADHHDGWSGHFYSHHNLLVEQSQLLHEVLLKEIRRASSQPQLGEEENGRLALTALASRHHLNAKDRFSNPKQ